VPYFAKEDDVHPAGVEVLEEDMDQMDSKKLQIQIPTTKCHGRVHEDFVNRGVGISV
jgi:hypothetical protein